MKLVDDVKRVLWYERALFHKRPRLTLAIVGAMFIPALYATIYLLSAWDPYGHLDALPVALVNLDQGVDVRGEHVIIGQRIVDKLTAAKTFAWQSAASEEEAQARVTHGDVVFAAIIPADFSKNAVPAAHETPGRIRILYSEGNNFMAATIAKRFAGELAHGTNETLNEQRWTVVLDTVDRSRGSLAQLRAGVAQLDDGAHKLAAGLTEAKDGSDKLATGLNRAQEGAHKLDDGAHKLGDGVALLGDGVQKLGGGLRTLDEKLPPPEVLKQLKDGARQVADGNDALASGITQLAAGSTKAKDGAGKLKDGTAKIPIVGKKISEGAGELEGGLQKLEVGLVSARGGADKLKDGSKKLDDGVIKLSDGVQQAHDGVHTMATKIPPDATLAVLTSGAHELADGTHALDDGMKALAAGSAQLDGGLAQLSDGSRKLSAGLDLLASSLPAGADALDGDAQGLAASVQPEMRALTSVGPYGNSMAPYFVALSLWVGVVISGFIFKLRWFPARLRRSSRLALVLGRLTVPLVMALGQATLLALALRFVIHAEVPSLAGLWLICAVTSTVYLSILLMLVALFGDVGKVIALLLLVFQMSASAGVFPVELSAGVFRFVHPWLPFTWVVQATRALLFGAYDGAWLPALARVAAFGVLAVVVTAVLGRWKWVPRHEFTPLLDV